MQPVKHAIQKLAAPSQMHYVSCAHPTEHEHLSFAQPSISLARSKTTNACPIIGWRDLHASAQGRVFPNGGNLKSRDLARTLSNATSPSQPFYYAVPVLAKTAEE
ncbi:hypothetical protein FRC05_011494 [Tulasnella sp. 425]|nr:hypothetical protein FRC05_011494 [Tulasnella sp. 425]